MFRDSDLEGAAVKILMQKDGISGGEKFQTMRERRMREQEEEVRESRGRVVGVLPREKQGMGVRSSGDSDGIQHQKEDDDVDER